MSGASLTSGRSRVAPNWPLVGGTRSGPFDPASATPCPGPALIVNSTLSVTSAFELL